MSKTKWPFADLLKAKPAKKSGGGKTSGNRRSPFHAREVAIFLLFAGFVAIAALGASGMTSETAIARGVRVGPFVVGGLTKEEARGMIAEGLDGYALRFIADNAATHDIPVRTDGGSDIRVDVNEAVDAAFAVGRGSNTLLAAVDRLKAVAVGASIPLPHRIDPQALTAELTNGFPTLVRPARDAAFRITVHTDGTHDLRIEPESAGTNFNADALIAAIAQRIDALSEEPVQVTVSSDAPALAVGDVQPLADDVAAALERAPFTVNAEGEQWSLSKSTVADWLVPAVAEDGTATLALDATKVAIYLEARGAAIAVDPVDAVFVEKNGRVVEFLPHADGKKLDVQASHDLLTSVLLGNEPVTEDDGVIELPVMTAPPEITVADANPYGIEEIIGVGESNFRGSPANRRKNIARGAALMNGILVAPDEEFSLIAALRPFDGANGYLPELVIKENRTVPEYGGGLCQIGTTTFRGVLDSGLPVTARQNHSYRVPYYERDGDGNYMGPGTDATIYEPSPDFRFKNDTGAHIMITTKIAGDRLTFTYWGKKDGRKAEMSEVSVFNVIAPPPTKIIKTTDLAPGVKNCTEVSHVGSTAVFTYTVEYPDGEVREEDFRSVYRPWQAVCLLGVTEEELAAEQADENGGDQEEAPVDDAEAALPSADAQGADGN